MKRKIRWDNIIWLVFEVTKWALMLGLLAWIVGSYVEVLAYRGVAGHDFSRNFIEVMKNIIGG